MLAAMTAVLDEVNHTMDIANEETFGPVACVIRCPQDEAVRLANQSVFGLGATVFGQDTRTKAVARQPTLEWLGSIEGSVARSVRRGSARVKVGTAIIIH